MYGVLRQEHPYIYNLESSFPYSKGKEDSYIFIHFIIFPFEGKIIKWMNIRVNKDPE